MSQFRFLLLFVCCFCVCSSSTLAQSNCYQTLLERGQAAYEALQFEKAIQQFEAASGCPEVDETELAAWLNKAQNGYIETIKKERNRARSLALTARSVLALQKDDDAAKAYQLARYAVAMDDNDDARGALYSSVYHLDDDGERRLFCHRTVPIGWPDHVEVDDLDITADGRFITAFSRGEGQIKIFDHEGQLLAESQSNGYEFDRRNYNPFDSSFIVISEFTPQVIPFRNGKLAETPRLTFSTGDLIPRSVQFSPNGQYILVTGTMGAGWLYNLEGELLDTLSGLNGSVTYCNFSLDSEWLIAADHERRVVIYEIDANKKLKMVLTHADKAIYDPRVSLSPDKQHFMLSNGYSRSILYDLNSKVIAEGSYTKTSQASFSEDGLQFLLGDIVYDLKEGENYGKSLFDLNQRASQSIFLPGNRDRKRLAAASWEKKARLWAINYNQAIPVGRLGGHTDDIRKMIFFPNQERLLTYGFDQRMRFWDLAGSIGAYVFESNHRLLTSHFAGDTLTIVSAKENQICHWFMNSSDYGRRWLSESFEIVASSADGRYFLIHDKEEKQAQVWQLNDQGRLAYLGGYTLDENIVQAEFQGERVAMFIVGSINFGLVVWDFKNAKTRYLSGYRELLASLAWSPNGEILAAGDHNGEIYEWRVPENLEENELVRSWSGHKQSVSALCWSPSGDRLASGSWDHRIIIWSAEGQPLLNFKAHNMEINDLDYSSDGRFLASGSEDQTAKIWGTEGQLVVTISGGNSDVKAIQFSPDDAHLILENTYGSLRSLPFAPYLVEQRFDYLPDLSAEEKTKYGVE